MTVHLYLAPAGHGKTAYVLERIRQSRAADPLTPVSVILPNQAQVSAFRHRLSAGGGALGVSLGTFYNLYPELLARAGKLEPRLPEAVQYRLLRSIVARLTDEGRLPYYAPLRDKPGFVAVLRALLEELKRASIRRGPFRQAIETLSGRGTRLAELAEIYSAYQDWLLDHNWADTEGQGWLAALALKHQPHLGRHLRLLIVDGFDEFNPTQLAVLKLLAQRATETIVTLTGELNHSHIPQSKISHFDIARPATTEGAEGLNKQPERSRKDQAPQSAIQNPQSKIARSAFRRFTRALQAVSHALNLKPEPLPNPQSPIPNPQSPIPNPQSPIPNPQSAIRNPQSAIRSPKSAALVHLEANLFTPRPHSVPAGEAVTFLEAQNRAEETRAALRWLKVRLVRDQMAPAEVALLARDLAPYRPFIEETAAEFGLTLHLREGLNLATSPAIAALMSLLSLPVEDDNAESNWARRPVIDAWRSPYFENLAPGITPRDADRLDAVARQGLVMQGLGQWREALARQVKQAANRDETSAPSALVDEDLIAPDQLSPAEALALQSAFEAFVSRLTPPPQATFREYAAFIEDLIGADPKLRRKGESGSSRVEVEGQPSATDTPLDKTDQSLGIVNRVRAVEVTAPRDIAALRALKDVLRGLVLAEAALRQSSTEPALDNTETITYDRFYEELRGAVQGATYYLPPPDRLAAAIPVLSVLNARGLSFRAAALIGLAEGEFPHPEREDILLREEDRLALQQAGLAALEPRLRGDEITFFYQAVTRAREKLLLCRPYLAGDGQTWEPSSYWKEVQRLVDAPVQHIRPQDPLLPAEVASPQEFTRQGAPAQPGLAELDLGDHWQSIDAAAHLLGSAAVLQARLAAEPQDSPAFSVFEGDLTGLAERFSTAYGPEHIWSSSRLEAYGLCPHHFWLGQALALEPRRPPDEGFDVFILGNMYHAVLEEVYRQAGSLADGERLLELLPAVARQLFDEAPEKYGFRPTPLWDMQRRELKQILAQTLAALAEATAGSTPLAQEQVFGIDDEPPLVVRGDGHEFRVRGFIDRVDQDPDGRLRIIDYKSGSTPIAARDLAEGRRLQIALYALAARDALALGDIAGGFYWHIGSAKASSLKLEKFKGGVDGALQTAIAHAFNHIAGVRAGRFAPMPPATGCPGHCPGASFCWRYKAKGW